MDIFWFIPSHGDSRYVGTDIGKRTTSLAYLTQVAQAVDTLGYGGALLPTGRLCEDSWVVASALIPTTKRMKFLIAVRPGSLSPTLAARMAVSLDRLSGGRLLINIITGGDPVELAGDGTFLNHDERYEVTDEFMTIWRQLFAGDNVTFKGKHLALEGAQLAWPSMQQPYPPLYFGGSSDAAIRTAAKHIDVYLSLGEPPNKLAEKIKRVREAAEKEGRTVRFGLRVHVFVRETDEAAWAAAENVMRHVDEETIAKQQEYLKRFDSVGQARTRTLHSGSRESLEVSPNLWAGIGLVNKGVGTSLVGDADTVAERLHEYYNMGVDTFILSSYPHLEEAYTVADLLFPRLPEFQAARKARDEVYNHEMLPLTQP